MLQSYKTTTINAVVVFLCIAVSTVDAAPVHRTWMKSLMILFPTTPAAPFTTTVQDPVRYTTPVYTTPTYKAPTTTARITTIAHGPIVTTYFVGEPYEPNTGAEPFNPLRPVTTTKPLIPTGYSNSGP
ncbi:hypothetical protein BC829DRAFT_491269 [Chytridium lagenaria]|nr:hypothetical protein BC829DRAFT_491269 [Chytridium lagenaria]